MTLLPASSSQAFDESDAVGAVAEDDSDSTGGGGGSADSTTPAVDPSTEVLSTSEHSPMTLLPASSSQAVDESDAVGAVAEDHSDSTGGGGAAADSTAPAVDPPTEVLSTSEHSPMTLLPASSSQAVDESDAVGDPAPTEGGNFFIEQATNENYAPTDDGCAPPTCIVAP